MQINELGNKELTAAVSARSAVRVTRGWAKGMTGILLGYNLQYDTVRIGFVDEAGNYTGEKTTVAASEVETVEADTSERHQDNRPDADALFMADLIDAEGTVWEFWKGSLYRNGHGAAIPSAFLVGASRSEYGTWV